MKDNDIVVGYNDFSVGFAYHCPNCGRLIKVFTHSQENNLGCPCGANFGITFIEALDYRDERIANVALTLARYVLEMTGPLCESKEAALARKILAERGQ